MKNINSQLIFNNNLKDALQKPDPFKKAGEVVDLTGKKIKNPKVKIPHIGWNNIRIINNNNLLKDCQDENFYFVHSFSINGIKKSEIASYTNYGDDFISSINKDNIDDSILKNCT